MCVYLYMRVYMCASVRLSYIIKYGIIIWRMCFCCLICVSPSHNNISYRDCLHVHTYYYITAYTYVVVLLVQYGRRKTRRSPTYNVYTRVCYDQSHITFTGVRTIYYNNIPTTVFAWLGIEQTLCSVVSK